ncbi:phage major capsid protein [Marinovum algicola]|uniref:phage major capsid protein n=1 Tax=Marinovum algicola TaxID=42444 RepID=UPI003B519011
MDINDLRRKRKEASARMETAADTLTELENATDVSDQEAHATALSEAEAAFDAAKAEHAKFDKQVKRAEETEAAQAQAAQSEVDDDAGQQQPRGGSAQVKEKGLRFGAMMRTLAAAGGNPRLAREIAAENGQSGLFASQNVTNSEAGGVLVPEDVADEVIELLRPASVVMGMGPRFIPMPNGNFTQNRRATGATFSYTGENDDIGVTGYTYGQMKLSAKKASGIIPISNDLITMASTAADRMVRDDALADAGVHVDRYFLRGAGTDFAPKGLRYQLVGSALESLNILAMTASPTLQKVDNDLGRLELALKNQNVNVSEAHWILSPRSEIYLMNLRDGNGNKAYPEMADGRLRGKPYHVTTEIPDNLGSGGDESEVMLVAPRHVVVGETNGINIAMSSEAAYKDSNGTLQSAFSRDETLMRMILQHDIGLRHLAAVAILTGVTWNPTA